MLTVTVTLQQHVASADQASVRHDEELFGPRSPSAEPAEEKQDPSDPPVSVNPVHHGTQ